MKKPVTVLALLIVTIFSLSAAPYLGVGQSVTSTSVDIGYLTKSIDQNLSLSLPLSGALASSEPWYSTPVASLNILFRKRVGSLVTLGLGTSMRVGWEYQKAISLQAGVLAQLSLEAIGAKNILFVELGYLPKWLRWTEGSASSSLLQDSVTQFIRLGYRRAL